MEKPSTRFILYTGLRTIGGVNASVSLSAAGPMTLPLPYMTEKFWSAAAAGSMTDSAPGSCPG